MDMKVYDRNLAGAAAGSTRTAETQKAETRSGNTSSSANRSGGDHVEISGTLGRLSQALSAQGTQRAAKVAALAAAYRSGAYQPDAAGTSKGLVAEALSGTGGQ